MRPKAMITEPYPGPRPFNAGEHCVFFGRDEEIADLRDLIMSYQIVVLYSQSGAGKSSLVRAGLRHALLSQRVRLLSARISGDAPVTTDTSSNIYVQNALASLLRKGEVDFKQSFSENIARKLHRNNKQARRSAVIIFDQFEELFTAYPDRWRDRDGFFMAIQEAVKKDPGLRILFVLREEHLAELDAYSDLVPFNFRIRYRLERLKEDAALDAIQRPARAFSYCVPEEDAKKLIANLRQIKVRSAGSIREAEGEYIEPVHLQVVCHDMWRKRSTESRTLSVPGNVEDIDATLVSYYDTAVKRAATEGGIRESKIRNWFERELITPRGTRSFVFKGDDSTRGLPNFALGLLEQEHIVRSEPRGAGSWYELTHDRLIAPISRSNAAWRRKRRRGRWPIYAALVLIAAPSLYLVARAEVKAHATHNAIEAERDRANGLKEATDSVFKGDGLAIQKQWQESIHSYDRALELYNHWMNNSKQAGLHKAKGLAYMHLHKYSKAQEEFKLAIHDSNVESDPDLVAQLGLALFKDGQTKDAIKEYQIAVAQLNSCEGEGNEKRAEIFRYLAEAQLRRGDFSDAEMSYFRAMTCITTFEQAGETFDDIFGIGLVASQKGKYKEGLDLYEASWFSRMHQLPSMVRVRVQLNPPARLLREMGFDHLHTQDYDEAFTELEEAYKEATKRKDEEQKAYASLALAEYYLEKAENKTNRTGTTRKSDKTLPLHNMATRPDITQVNKSLEEAEAAANGFADLNDKVMHGASLTYQARAHIIRGVDSRNKDEKDRSKEEFRQAGAELEEAYKSQLDSDRRIGQAYALQAKGMLFEAQDNFCEGLKYYKESFNIYASIGSISIHKNEVEESVLKLQSLHPCPSNQSVR
jgi:tetratricopeptide (TPR) repeat protein